MGKRKRDGDDGKYTSVQYRLVCDKVVAAAAVALQARSRKLEARAPKLPSDNTCRGLNPSRQTRSWVQKVGEKMEKGALGIKHRSESPKVELDPDGQVPISWMRVRPSQSGFWRDGISVICVRPFRRIRNQSKSIGGSRGCNIRI